MNSTEECSQLIAQLGFTGLEAEIYVYLLQQSPATGYKIAKEIGRSFTNTYKALTSLRSKGAILADEGPSQLTRAVPLEEVLGQMEARFLDLRKRAITAVDQLTQSVADNRIYQLVSVPQVIERCKRVLSEAEERVLIELFPLPVTLLRDDVEQTAARGVDVSARVYRPVSLKGVRMVKSPFGEQTLELLRTEWLAIFVDGRQVVMAQLLPGGEGVYQAIWSRNPSLARSFYDYVNSDLHHYAFRERLMAASSLEEVRAAYRELQEAFPPGGDLGFRDMQRTFNKGWADSEKRNEVGA